MCVLRNAGLVGIGSLVEVRIGGGEDPVLEVGDLSGFGRHLVVALEEEVVGLTRRRVDCGGL